MDAPRYGTLDAGYLATWFDRQDPGGPMWALNLMRYRPVADYADGRETTLSGQEADDLYAPRGPLEAIGARIVLVAPVVHQLVGDGTRWDRVAIAQYPSRAAMIEMNQRDDFKELHIHKEAGMASTIVMATFPSGDRPAPDSGTSGRDVDQLMLIQVVSDPRAPDLAETVDAVRIGRFDVEGVIVGDGRPFAEVRYDLISRDTADSLASDGGAGDDASSYVLVVDPVEDALSASLADPTVVQL